MDDKREAQTTAILFLLNAQEKKIIYCFKLVSNRFITEYCYAICWEKNTDFYLISTPFNSETIWYFFKLRQTRVGNSESVLILNWLNF